MREDIISGVAVLCRNSCGQFPFEKSARFNVLRYLGRLKPVFTWKPHILYPSLVAGAPLAYGLHKGMQHASEFGDSGPYSWFRKKSLSPDELWERNISRYNQMVADLQKQVDDAWAAGDADTANELSKLYDKGDFGGSWLPRWLGGWANASYYRQQALEQQKNLQNRYNEEMKSVGPTPENMRRLNELKQLLESNDLLPDQVGAIERRIAALNRRIALQPGMETEYARQIRERMEGNYEDSPIRTPMRFVPWKPQSSPARPKNSGKATVAAAAPWLPANMEYYYPWMLNPNVNVPSSAFDTLAMQ